MNEDNKPEPKVGYGRPPTASQWKPGQSGNPTGKRKAKKGFAADIAEAYALTISATLGGKPIQLTAKEAIVKALVDKAENGNKPALKMLLDLRDHAGAMGDIEPLIVDMTEDLARCL